MGVNLVSLINGYFSNEVINLVSRAIGDTNEQTKSTIEAVIPGLLSKLVKITSSKLAIEALFQSVNNQDEKILDNLVENLIDDKYTKVTSTGKFYVNSLFGLRGANNLVNSISRHSGLKKNASDALLGLVTPVALSSIKSILVKDDKLTSADMVELMKDQQEAINNSLPNNFFDEEPEVEKPIVQLTTPPPSESSGASFITKIVPLLLLPAILYFIYHFFYKQPDSPMMLPGMQTVEELNANSKFSKEERKSLEELSVLLGSVETILKEITDKKSAKLKLTGLEKKIQSIDELSQKMKNMSQATRLQAASLVKSRIPKMQPAVDRIHKIPGITQTIKPVMDKLVKISVDAFI